MAPFHLTFPRVLPVAACHDVAWLLFLAFAMHIAGMRAVTIWCTASIKPCSRPLVHTCGRCRPDCHGGMWSIVCWHFTLAEVEYRCEGA